MDNQVIDYINSLQLPAQAFRNLSDSLLLPKIVQIKNNLYAAIFNIMKLLPAKHIISEAIKRNEINQDSVIVDTSSGTFALGIGLVCAELGLPFKIFGDPAIDEILIQRLEDLGGNVHISKNPKNPGAYQRLRLEALHNFISQNKLSFWMRQYDNLDNSGAYAIVGNLITHLLGANVNLVGTVGSGGSTGGTIKAIRTKNPAAKLIGVDTFNSVLFGQPDGKRILRGLGNTIMPKNLNHTYYDQIHWVSANDAFHYTRWLFSNKAIFCGPTTGAAYQVADYLASHHKSETYVFIAPDEGYRYLTTLYDKNWLTTQNFYTPHITVVPKEIFSPIEAKEPWAYFNWNRRSYQEVMGKEFHENKN